jgi:hypothetical protein
MKKTVIASSLLFALPFLASAQQLQPLVNLVQSVGHIVNLLIPILVALAIVVFFWGLVLYIRKSGGEKATDEGRRIMIAGLISLFIMVSVWGIVNLAQQALGVPSQGSVQIPTVQY